MANGKKLSDCLNESTKKIFEELPENNAREINIDWEEEHDRLREVIAKKDFEKLDTERKEKIQKIISSEEMKLVDICSTGLYLMSSEVIEYEYEPYQYQYFEDLVEIDESNEIIYI